MASSKDRQRKLARAKLDRQMARRAARESRKRRILAGVGASAAVLLIVAGVAWIGGAFDGDDKQPAAAQDVCAWTAQNATANTHLKEVGTPPTKDIPQSGQQTMTVTTNQGAPIVVSLDNVLSPCGSANLAHLAGKKFYDNTDCHEITAYGALRCGDPSGTGLGGPTYTGYGENVPSLPDPSASPAGGADPKKPLYPKGTVALIGNPPGANGSQFLVFFRDYSPPTPEFAIVGSVAGGQDTLTKISKIPTVANDAGDKVKPKQKITITSLTVGNAPAAGSSPASAPAAPPASPPASLAPSTQS